MLAESQALVFPSLCEGFGLVILEAFEQKKPVLVSDIMPLSDIVSNNFNGFVISPLNEDKWAKTMKNIMLDPRNSLMIGQRGEELLKTNYNIKKMHEQVMSMYRGVMR